MVIRNISFSKVRLQIHYHILLNTFQISSIITLKLYTKSCKVKTVLLNVSDHTKALKSILQQRSGREMLVKS